MKPSRRRLIAASSLALSAVLVGAGWRVAETVATGVAYKAKLACSGIFVSKRDPAAVLTDLQIDDLSILKYVGVGADLSTGTVTASALGLFRRQAIYRDGLGCALVLDGLTPPVWPAGTVGETADAGTPGRDGLPVGGATERTKWQR
jgi:hypothetical protein